MTGLSSTTYLSGARARLCASGALVLVAMTCTFAFCISSQAGAHGAQTHGSGTHTHSAATLARKDYVHTHSAGAQAHKAACSAAHAKHGPHACAPSKFHKHKAKIEAHHKHANDSRRTSAQGIVQTPPALAPGGSSGATCSDGINATLNEEGTFACANGAEPGCQEGFAPVVASDASTLICEPEPGEVGGNEEG
ncbi:MAG: hypothetical protein WB709_05590 [Solirubrobacteraceae bacterium]